MSARRKGEPAILYGRRPPPATRAQAPIRHERRDRRPRAVPVPARARAPHDHYGPLGEAARPHASVARRRGVPAPCRRIEAFAGRARPRNRPRSKSRRLRLQPRPSGETESNRLHRIDGSRTGRPRLPVVRGVIRRTPIGSLEKEPGPLSPLSDRTGETRPVKPQKNINSDILAGPRRAPPARAAISGSARLMARRSEPAERSKPADPVLTKSSRLGANPRFASPFRRKRRRRPAARPYPPPAGRSASLAPGRPIRKGRILA